MINEIAGSVAGARVGEAQGFFKRNWRPIEIGAFGGRPSPGEGLREEVFREEQGILDRMIRIRGAGFLNQAIRAVHFVVPRTSVPMVATDKIQYPAPGYVQRDVEIVGELVEEMAGVGAFVPAAPIVSAPHVSPGADALLRPAVPETISVKADGNDGRCGGAIV